jgi:hypothetical protein
MSSPCCAILSALAAILLLAGLAALFVALFGSHKSTTTSTSKLRIYQWTRLFIIQKSTSVFRCR